MRNPYHKPRRAYCTGCGVTFPKMHEMINHRRTFRCGGRFLPDEEVVLLWHKKYWQQRYDHTNDRTFALNANAYRIQLNRMRHDRVQKAQAAARRQSQ